MIYSMYDVCKKYDIPATTLWEWVREYKHIPEPSHRIGRRDFYTAKEVQCMETKIRELKGKA